MTKLKVGILGATGMAYESALIKEAGPAKPYDEDVSYLSK